MKPAVKIFSLLSTLASATEADIWITEVLPATGQIEVTNVSEEVTILERELIFCHRFNYGTSIPAGTEFAAGESLIFTVNFSNPDSSDLWLYNARSFGSAAAILTGLQWNTTSIIGRSALASTAGRWNGGTASAPAPAAGQSIQLTGDDPFSSESWTVGTPNLGVFGEVAEPEPEVEPVSLSIQREGTDLILNWQGGIPPYQIQVSDDLASGFQPLEGFTNELTATIPLSGERQFYRVVSMAMLPQTARFRVTFSSLWSGLSFNNTPANPTLGDLIGSTHNDQVSFWAPGENASDGVALLASTGSTAQLSVEVGLSIANELANQFIAGPGVDQELGTSTFEITVDRDFPLLTLTSRLNESPDWFTGVQNLNLIGDNQNFLDRIEIMLMPWDAGFDSGLAFGGPAFPTVPQAPVESLTDNPAFLPSIFLGIQSEPIPIGALIIERIIE